ncbi:MAG TPA: hypothetical protein VFE68_13140 [Vicinamibacteria bacterium]|jgi:hypothetical protein|nr:hypothetical protein [Vicinamibacteria bacterium]
MDDARIEQLRREVLSQIGSSPTERATHDLESRVAALEAAVADLLGGHHRDAWLQGARPLPTAPRGYAHPSLQVLGPGGGGDRCVMEPDKPCVQSHACRTFGH